MRSFVARRRKALLVLTLGAPLLFDAPAARAQAQGAAPSADAARADALFTEGSRLFDAGKYAEACAKLDESQRLDPAVGTQFNLAECWQRMGRFTKARELYEEVVRIAHAAGKAELEQRAREKLVSVEAVIPRLKVVVGHPPPETVSLDGVARPMVELAKGVLIDPGRHEIEASAPGKRPFRTAFSALAGERPTVTIPVLADAPRDPGQDPNIGDTQRTAAWITLGVGAAGVIVGSIFGGVSLSKNGTASDTCPDPRAGCTTDEGVSAWRDARAAGNVSTVAFIIGGVALAAGAVLWFTAPRPSGVSIGVNVHGPLARVTW